VFSSAFLMAFVVVKVGRSGYASAVENGQAGLILGLRMGDRWKSDGILGFGI
jgi:hypothetical protein